MIKTVRRSIPPLYQQVNLHGYKVSFEIDSGANDMMYNKETWIEIWKPKLQPVESQHKFSGGNPLQTTMPTHIYGNPLQVLGQFEVTD